MATDGEGEDKQYGYKNDAGEFIPFGSIYHNIVYATFVTINSLQTINLDLSMYTGLMIFGYRSYLVETNPTAKDFNGDIIEPLDVKTTYTNPETIEFLLYDVTNVDTLTIKLQPYPQLAAYYWITIVN